jgi:hypothetical protein
LDLQLCSRNKATVIAVEEPTVTKSKISMAGPEFNKEHAHSLFNVKGETKCATKDRDFGAATPSSFITTTGPPTCP